MSGLTGEHKTKIALINLQVIFRDPNSEGGPMAPV